MIRRDFLKNLGVMTAGAAIAPSLLTETALAAETSAIAAPAEPVIDYIHYPVRPLRPEISKQLTVAIVGAGNRGRTYAGYAKMFPDAMKVVAVSDIRENRKLDMAMKHDIAPENQFGDFHEILSRPKLADVMMICTPDDLHFEPCMKALELGYDVLLEKPVAQSEKECRLLLAQAKKYNRIVAVCHVLRYAPYFIAMKKVLEEGMIGDIVSIQHMEPIQYAHMAHSYVRGNWRDSKETTPIIIAKSCHDLDIIRWMLDKPCKTITADGDLYFFKKENAPEGAPLRCTDGCPHEATCPYSAIDVYVRKKQHLGVFDLKNSRDEDEIYAKMKDSWYGRCVFHCDNNQPDHFVSNMVFEDNITAAFSMEAFTPYGGRRTRVMGTTGYIEGDGTTFNVWDHRAHKYKTWNMSVQDVDEYKGSGHGGGDYALVRDFLEAVASQDQSRLSSTLDVSMESHIMGFRAEKSRLSNKKVKVSL